MQLQAAANQSPQVQQLKALQRSADSRPGAQQGVLSLKAPAGSPGAGPIQRNLNRDRKGTIETALRDGGAIKDLADQLHWDWEDPELVLSEKLQNDNYYTLANILKELQMPPASDNISSLASHLRNKIKSNTRGLSYLDPAMNDSESEQDISGYIHSEISSFSPSKQEKALIIKLAAMQPTAGLISKKQGAAADGQVYHDTTPRSNITIFYILSGGFKVVGIGGHTGNTNKKYSLTHNASTYVGGKVDLTK